MADINYKGLTGLEGTVTVTLATDTFDSLITAIASDEGLPTDYYHVALERDPTINDLYFADSSTPLTLDDASIGMVDGDKVICTPNQDGTKEERQVRKLEIAQLKRQGGSAGDTSARYYRTKNIYDRNLLPTYYNDNEIYNTPNTGGLQLGRPWGDDIPGAETDGITFAAGISRIVYSGYFGDTSSPYDDSGPYTTWWNGGVGLTVLSGPTYPTTVADTLSSGENDRTVIFRGYFLAPSTATYDLYIQSDDASYLWLGDNALDANRTIANATVSQPGLQAFGTPGVDGVGGTFDMVAGSYYYLTVVYGNGPAGPGQFALSYRESGVGASYSSDFTGVLFYNSATGGH